ncbi:protein ALP1-like [Rhagoletis pomonella]|uniref:protein ALP1-like n=2 Tax=Rhagoletis pomonella TaxID=28610 RepID=UPI00177D918C|nr:protein ALP1-like [Rhagoletis pomonella]XP_036325437.1 protein ALP1-like [Rhagoletis pomonella]
MEAPTRCGSTYFNYKGTHSIVLMAIADAEYKFVYIDVGCNGRVSDGGVFGKSTFQHALNMNSLGLPSSRPLEGRELNVPYVLVADDAFRMQKHLLKPYPGRNLSAGQRIFNYRLSRARRIVENVFGIMAKRFQVFSRPIRLNPTKTTKVTMACCALHNFLITKSSNYVESQTDEEGNLIPIEFNQVSLRPVQEGTVEQPNNYISNEAKEIRREFEEYFMSVNGEVPFQYRHL